MIPLGKVYHIDDDGNLRNAQEQVIDDLPLWCEESFAKHGSDPKYTSLTGERVTHFTISGIRVRRFESATGKVWWCPASATVNEVMRSFHELEKLKHEHPEMFAVPAEAKKGSQ